MPFEFVRPGTHIDFLGQRRVAMGISLALLAAGCVAVAINGVKMGIDFKGGTEMQVLFDPGIEVDESPIRLVLGACGVDDASVVRYGETADQEFLIRFQAGERAGEAGDDCRLNPEQVAALARARLAGGGEGDVGEKTQIPLPTHGGEQALIGGESIIDTVHPVAQRGQVRLQHPGPGRQPHEAPVADAEAQMLLGLGETVAPSCLTSETGETRDDALPGFRPDPARAAERSPEELSGQLIATQLVEQCCQLVGGRVAELLGSRGGQ